MDKEQRIKEIKEEIAMINYDIWLTQMSEDSFEPYTQSSQYIHQCWDKIRILERELKEMGVSNDGEDR